MTTPGVNELADVATDERLGAAVPVAGIVGAAVAGGLAGFALGTETWGSILCPSAFCGLTGLRPSRSSSSTLRICEMVTLPLTISPMEGRVMARRPACEHISSARRLF